MSRSKAAETKEQERRGMIAKSRRSSGEIGRRKIANLQKYIERRTAWRDEQQDNAEWCLGQVTEANADIARAEAEIQALEASREGG